MRGFNLLPAKIIKLRQTWRARLYIAAAETLILLTLLALTAGVHIYANRLKNQAAALETALNDPKYLLPDDISSMLSTAGQAASDALELNLLLPEDWLVHNTLSAVRRAVPDGAALTDADIYGPRVTLTMTAPDIRAAGRQWQSLKDTGVFTRVLYGPMIRLTDESVKYTLILETR